MNKDDRIVGPNPEEIRQPIVELGEPWGFEFVGDNEFISGKPLPRPEPEKVVDGMVEVMYIAEVGDDNGATIEEVYIGHDQLQAMEWIEIGEDSKDE